MDLLKVNNLYFLGIGGIGMSALARYFNRQGKNIVGYDLTPSPLTDRLEKEGMKIHYNEDVTKIPADIDLAVYTPAIPADNSELEHLKSTGIPLLKRAGLLGRMTESHFAIAVAGTHGKTSISAMITHIFNQAGKNITALVGGIMNNYRSNVVINRQDDFLLVEADEFDRSFLTIEPDISVISSLDADHLDVYRDKENLRKNFLRFAAKLSGEGLLIHHTGLKLFDEIKTRKISYGISEEAQVRAENIVIKKGNFVFDLVFGKLRISAIQMTIPGFHYIENALAAAAVSLESGIQPEGIRSGLESFKGVERRFEYRIRTGKTIFIDDYAHHPREISATITAVKSLYPDKKITGIFQPHLYSRTRDFAKEFAASLEPLDEVVLLPVYPAREKPIQGVEADIIYENLKNSNKIIVQREELLGYLENENTDVLLTLGAGDIGLLVPEIEKLLKRK